MPETKPGGPGPEEIDLAHEEALKFNEQVESRKVTPQEMREKLISREMTPETFLEFLQNERNGDILLYLMSRPGTCSHVFLDPKDLSRFKESINNNQLLEAQPKSVKSEGPRHYESFLSLHVANRSGISTIAESQWNWAHLTYSESAGGPINFLGRGGFILKQEFFIERMNISDLTKEERNRAVDTYNIENPEDDSGHTNLRGALFYAGELQRALKNPESPDVNISKFERGFKDGMNPNFGIRAVTIEGDHVVPLAISPFDIEYYFEIETVPPNLYSQGGIQSQGRFGERIRFFRADGTEVQEKELEELHQEVKHANIWERYEQYFRDVPHVLTEFQPNNPTLERTISEKKKELNTMIHDDIEGLAAVAQQFGIDTNDLSPELKIEPHHTTQAQIKGLETPPSVGTSENIETKFQSLRGDRFIEELKLMGRRVLTEQEYQAVHQFMELRENLLEIHSLEQAKNFLKEGALTDFNLFYLVQSADAAGFRKYSNLCGWISGVTYIDKETIDKAQRVVSTIFNSSEASPFQEEISLLSNIIAQLVTIYHERYYYMLELAQSGDPRFTRLTDDTGEHYKILENFQFTEEDARKARELNLPWSRIEKEAGEEGAKQ